MARGPEARGPMQLHWLHRPKAGPGLKSLTALSITSKKLPVHIHQIPVA